MDRKEWLTRAEQLEREARKLRRAVQMSPQAYENILLAAKVQLDRLIDINNQEIEGAAI